MMKHVNGVDVEKLSETMTAINGNPEIAKFSFRATNKWLGDRYNRTTINEFNGACPTV